MRQENLLPQFVLVTGGAGSGKNHFIEHHPVYSTYKLIDVDTFKAGKSIPSIISELWDRLESSFHANENVVHTTMAVNLKGQISKIALAHENNYFVTLILIDTPPQTAINQVFNRVASGGHHVPDQNVLSSNAKCKENFKLLKSYADKSFVVTR